MYNQTVLDHFQNPRNAGEIADPDGVGEVSSGECGDATRIYIKVTDGIITDMKFKTFGCAAAIASSSAASEMIIGKSVEEALKLTRDDVANKLQGLPAKKLHCSNLSADAIHAAIADYVKRQGGNTH
ncbi:MAG: iron-sulfur cluster assembly scaffold protein [candidate division Zixibacteria bacterium]|nr:iron-sulfur cluster assembly scaffold protein [candidate division Zixibacteria bacterium]